ncbi:MAG: rod shape-determining protein MreC [Candidatus Omnitrophota bacterium]
MPSRKKKLILAFLAAAVIILAASVIPFLRKPLIDSLGWPLDFFSKISGHAQGIILYRQNQIQNQQLTKELSLINRQLHESEELYLENIRLRKLLDFKEKSAYPLTPANVVGYDPSNLSSIIIIDKGKKQGVKPGLAVIVNEGLVGRIIDAGDLTSKVLLIDDINSGVAAFIQRNRQKGLISGSLGGRIILHYLPPEADIEVGDLVITSGLGGLYPKGILIGRVAKIQEGGSHPEILAVVAPSANLTKLEEVLVVLSE